MRWCKLLNTELEIHKLVKQWSPCLGHLRITKEDLSTSHQTQITFQINSMTLLSAHFYQFNRSNAWSSSNTLLSWMKITSKMVKLWSRVWLRRIISNFTRTTEVLPSVVFLKTVQHGRSRWWLTKSRFILEH